jgi:hypothetical protein
MILIILAITTEASQQGDIAYFKKMWMWLINLEYPVKYVAITGKIILKRTALLFQQGSAV